MLSTGRSLHSPVLRAGALVGAAGVPTLSLTCTAEADCPCVNILRVTPHQVAEGPLMRNLADTLNRAHLWGSREALMEGTKYM